MTTTAPIPTAQSARFTPRAWAVLLVICGALFLEGIDVAMLNVAVPGIRNDLGIPLGQEHWVISAYILGYAGFMLLGGRVADIAGRRRVFLVALWIFVGFSVVGGVADTGWVIVVARFVTGIAAAFMAPAGFSIVTTSFAEGQARDRALAIYGAVGAAGFVLGQVVGGLLTTASWRWVFFGPVIIGAVLLLAGHRLIHVEEPAERATRPGFDVAGALAVTAGMVALIYAVVSGSEHGYDIAALGALVIAVALIAAFIIIESRSRSPLVRLALLREGALGVISLAGMLFMGAFMAFQFALTLYLQDIRGWNPLEVGLTFAIMGADLVLAPIAAPWLIRRFGNIAVMSAGFVVALVAYLLALRLTDDWGYLELLPSLALIAVAFALVYGPLTSAAAEGVAEAEQATAGGVVFTAMQFGGAVGVSTVTTVLLASHDADPGIADYQRALLVPAAGALLALIAGAVLLVRRAAARRRIA